MVGNATLFISINNWVDLFLINDKEFGEAANKKFIRNVGDFEFTIFREDDNAVKFSTFDVVAIVDLSADITTDFIIAKFYIGNCNFFGVDFFDTLNLGGARVLLAVLWD